MSEIMLGVMNMPEEMFFDPTPLVRRQHNAIRLEAAAEIENLRDALNDCTNRIIERDLQLKQLQQQNREKDARISRLESEIDAQNGCLLGQDQLLSEVSEYANKSGFDSIASMLLFPREEIEAAAIEAMPEKLEAILMSEQDDLIACCSFTKEEILKYAANLREGK